MKVKDLKTALNKLDPEAIVCIEAYSDCTAHIVKQYTFSDGEKHAYIADDMEYVETELFATPIVETMIGYEEV